MKWNEIKREHVQAREERELRKLHSIRGRYELKQTQEEANPYRNKIQTMKNIADTYILTWQTANTATAKAERAADLIEINLRRTLSRNLSGVQYTKDTLLGQKGECAINKNEIVHMTDQAGIIVDTKYEQIHKRCVAVAHLERQYDRLAAYRENLPGTLQKDQEGRIIGRIFNTTEELIPRRCKLGTHSSREEEGKLGTASADEVEEEEGTQNRNDATGQEINTDRAYQRIRAYKARVKEEYDDAYQNWIEWRNKICTENSESSNRENHKKKNKRRRPRKKAGNCKPKKKMTNQEVRAINGNTPNTQSTIKIVLWQVIKMEQPKQQIHNRTIDKAIDNLRDSLWILHTQTNLLTNDRDSMYLTQALEAAEEEWCELLQNYKRANKNWTDDNKRLMCVTKDIANHKGSLVPDYRDTNLWATTSLKPPMGPSTNNPATHPKEYHRSSYCPTRRIGHHGKQWKMQEFTRDYNPKDPKCWEIIKQQLSYEPTEAVARRIHAIGYSRQIIEKIQRTERLQRCATKQCKLVQIAERERSKTKGKTQRKYPPEDRADLRIAGDQGLCIYQLGEKIKVWTQEQLKGYTKYKEVTKIELKRVNEHIENIKLSESITNRASKQKRKRLQPPIKETIWDGKSSRGLIGKISPQEVTGGKTKPNKNMTNQEIRAAHGNIPDYQSTTITVLWNVLRFNQAEQLIQNRRVEKAINDLEEALWYLLTVITHLIEDRDNQEMKTAISHAYLALEDLQQRQESAESTWTHDNRKLMCVGRNVAGHKGYLVPDYPAFDLTLGPKGRKRPTQSWQGSIINMATHPTEYHKSRHHKPPWQSKQNYNRDYNPEDPRGWEIITQQLYYDYTEQDAKRNHATNYAKQIQNTLHKLKELLYSGIELYAKQSNTQKTNVTQGKEGNTKSIRPMTKQSFKLLGMLEYGLIIWGKK